MLEDLYYLDDGHVKICVASIGISNMHWVKINENEIFSDDYRIKMKENRFDVLPIVAVNGETNEYFKTDTLHDYKKISRYTIKDDDKISLDTDIQKVISDFYVENRTFYFLTSQNRLTGLITIGNLNCRQVQVYIFSKICDLERLLSKFIIENISVTEIIGYIKNKAKSNDKFKIILYNYQELVSLDLDNDITEYLYLIDFVEIIKKFALHENLGFLKKEWCSLDLNGVNELRNLVCHPTRSLLDRQNNIQMLVERLKVIENLTKKLKDIQRH